MSVLYAQSETDFCSASVFPICPVQKQSDRYFKYDKFGWFSTQAQKRASGTESAGTGFNIDSTPSYYADIYAVHKDVSDDLRANQDEPLNCDLDATRFVTRQLLLRREIDFLRTYMTPGVWTGAGTATTDYVPAKKWADPASNPVAEIDDLKSGVKGSTSYEPNTLVISYDVFNALKNHPVILERIKYTQTGLLTKDIMASLMGLDKIVIASAVLATSPEIAGATKNGSGIQTTMQFMAQNSGLLVYTPKTAGLMDVSGGYIFSWTGMFGAGAQGNRVSKFRMEHLKSDRVEGEMAYCMSVIAPDVGVYLKNIIA
jgi:hypothetical protein